VKVRDIIKRPEADGWRMIYQTGSHRQYKHPVKPGRVTCSGPPFNGYPGEDVERHIAASEAGMKYLVIYEKGPTSWGAYVPDLPGCVAVGQTQEEVRELIEGAIELHIRGMREDGDAIPEPTTLAADFVSVST
jgi:predicted RNase H-like HicB family nuclease/predicted RNA binding protein YcfA (HicA-like mRNA interferase family)